MTFADVQDYYDRCRNTDDVRKWLKDQPLNGYEEAFDGSLSVFFFKDFSVLVACSYIKQMKEV